MKDERPLKKMKVEHRESGFDCLSNLPDDIIRQILSLMDTRYAVQTCVLSKAWKYHWTGIQSLNFNDKSFSRWRDYGMFVRRVLRQRKPFHLRRLRYYCSCRKDKSLASRIFNYACKYNLEELETDLCTFPPSFYQCQTLRTLKIGPGCNTKSSVGPFGFKWLTTLQLFRIRLSSQGHNDLFSSFLNLQNLFLIECQMFYLETLNISAPQLVNLTISNLECYFILSYQKRLVISAPRLGFLDYNGIYPALFRTDKYQRVNIHLLSSTLVPVNMNDYYVIAYLWELIDCQLGYIKQLIDTTEGFAHRWILLSDLYRRKSIICHSNRDTPYAGTVMEIGWQLHIYLDEFLVFSWAPADFIATWRP